MTSFISNLESRSKHLLNKINVMEQFCNEANLNNEYKTLIKKTLQ